MLLSRLVTFSSQRFFGMINPSFSFLVAHSLQTYKWRKDNGINTILKDYTPDPELVALLPYEVVGFDKENCPSKSHYTCIVGHLKKLENSKNSSF